MPSAHCKIIGIGIVCMFASLAHAGILEHWPLDSSASDFGGRLTPRLYTLERSIRVDVASEASSLASSVQFGLALSGPIAQLPTPVGWQPVHVHVHVLELDAPGPLPPVWGHGSSNVDPDLPGHSVAGWIFGETPPVIDHAIASPQETVRLLVTLSAIHVRSDGEFRLSIEPNTGQATVQLAPFTQDIDRQSRWLSTPVWFARLTRIVVSPEMTWPAYWYRTAGPTYLDDGESTDIERRPVE